MLSKVALINLINIIIALALLLTVIRAYYSFKLRIFRNAWAVLALGGFLWVLGHVLMFFQKPSYIHYTLFTMFIVLLAVGVFMLTRAAKTLGGV